MYWLHPYSHESFLNDLFCLRGQNMIKVLRSSFLHELWFYTSFVNWTVVYILNNTFIQNNSLIAVYGFKKERAQIAFWSVYSRKQVHGKQQNGTFGCRDAPSQQHIQDSAICCWQATQSLLYFYHCACSLCTDGDLKIDLLPWLDETEVLCSQKSSLVFISTPFYLPSRSRSLWQFRFRNNSLNQS